MKKLLVLLMIFISTYSFSQSKQETVDFIKSRLDYNAQWNEKDYNELKLLKYDYQNDTLYYKVHYMIYGEPNESFRVDAIPIKDINPDRIRIVNMIGDSDDMGIELYTNYGRELIAEYYENPLIDGETMFYDTPCDFFPRCYKLTSKQATFVFPEWVIQTQGRDLTNRVKSAILHLIELSGGDGEKF